MENEDYKIIEDLLECCKKKEWVLIRNNCEELMRTIDICNEFKLDETTKRFVDLIVDCCNDCEEVIYRIYTTIDECHKYISKK